MPLYANKDGLPTTYMTSYLIFNEKLQVTYGGKIGHTVFFLWVLMGLLYMLLYCVVSAVNVLDAIECTHLHTF